MIEKRAAIFRQTWASTLTMAARFLSLLLKCFNSWRSHVARARRDVAPKYNQHWFVCHHNGRLKVITAQRQNSHSKPSFAELF